MRAFLPSKFAAPTYKSNLEQRADASLMMSTFGTERIPEAPRSVVAQGGSRKAVVTWEVPQNNRDIVGWNIYKNTEDGFVQHIPSPSLTRAEVAIDSGSTPPVTNIFVSSVNARGKESQKVLAQTAAATEASAPTDPTDPSGTPTGGGGVLPCFTPNTVVKTWDGELRFDELKANMRVVVGGTPRRIKQVLTHEFDGELLRIPGTDWGVTFEHYIKHNGWTAAKELYHERFHYAGIVYNLEIDAETFDERCYELGNGVIAHNSKAIDPYL